MSDPRDRGMRLGWLSIVLVVCLAAPCLADEFHVTTTADTNDGVCPSASQCSLRDAILATNSRPGHDTIHLPAGTYVFFLTGVDEDDSFTGDLDIKDHLDILGAGANVTIIDGGGIDRVFQLHRTLGPSEPIANLHDLTIRGGDLENVALPFGGGVFNYGATVSLVDCVVENNTGPAGQSGGGGIALAAQPSSPGVGHVINTTIRGNSTTWGGGIFALDSQLYIDRSTLSGNAAVNNRGGAVYLNASVAHATNSTFADNLSQIGAAFVSYHSSVSIDSCTFSNPSANLAAEEPEDEITLSNTVVAGSCVGDYFATLGGNIEGPGDTCSFVDPGDYSGVQILLLPLGDHGGPRATMPPDPVPGNVIIDNEWAETNCRSEDQRGLVRPQDGDGDGLAVCDSGAVEYHGLIFADGFESGNSSAWSATSP